MARPRRSRVTPERVILDSGPLISWSRGNVRARAMITRALELDSDISVPVVVLAETLRGGPGDAPINRVLRALDAHPTLPAAGRAAGALLGRAGGTNTGDALVMAEALASPGCTLLTSDPRDMRALLDGRDDVYLQVI